MRGAHDIAANHADAFKDPSIDPFLADFVHFQIRTEGKKFYFP
jgi:hypothetical protein